MSTLSSIPSLPSPLPLISSIIVRSLFLSSLPIPHTLSSPRFSTTSTVFQMHTEQWKSASPRPYLSSSESTIFEIERVLESETRRDKWEVGGVFWINPWRVRLFPFRNREKEGIVPGRSLALNQPPLRIQSFVGLCRLAERSLLTLALLCTRTCPRLQWHCMNSRSDCQPADHAVP